MITCKILNYPSDQDWLDIRNDALSSQRKTSTKVPDYDLRVKYLVSEHNPVYGLQYRFEFTDLPYWIAMHLKTHHVGVHQITSSQRNDIQGEYDRRKAPQDSLVNHRIISNPVSIITTSQKRQCFTASNETRYVWGLFISELYKVAPEVAGLCVKPCVYRNGFCPEVFSNCKFNTSENFRKELEEYKTHSKMKLPLDK